MYKKGNSHIRLSNYSFNSFYRRILQQTSIFPLENRSIKHNSKIANQPPPKQSPPTSSQENPITPTTTQNPQTSTRISFQDNPYTLEERHARLSEPLEPFHRQAPLSEPTYNLYPTLQQDLNRVRHISQNQNTLKVNRQSYTQDEIEIFKLHEFILAYLNHQHQLAQNSLAVHCQAPLHLLHNKAYQISHRTI